MGATSVTGLGLGSCGKPTMKELSSLHQGPDIIFTGITAASEVPSSPPSSGFNEVILPYVLEGGADKYVVLLTSIGGGDVFVAEMNEDDDGNLIGFTITAEADCDVMYLVAKVGTKPLLT